MKQATITTTIERRPIALLPQPPARPPLWMQLEDQASGVFGGKLRDCALAGGCPAVFVLLEPNLKTGISRDLQFFIRAINSGMSVSHVAAIFIYFRAFCNGTGLGDPNDPRANFLQGEDLTAPLPQFDKDRTCARSVMTGTPGYSLMAAIQQTFAAVKETIIRGQSFLAFRRSFRALLTENNVLELVTFDGNGRPPLKPGKNYPAKLADVSLDDYLYTPQTHPWMFFSANIVGERGQVVPFPNGAVYSWTGDNVPRTFLPHISRHRIRYPLARLRKLADTEPVPSPYRFV